MADEKKAPRGIEEVDGWTTNGFGLIINGEKVPPPKDDDVEEIEEV